MDERRQLELVVRDGEMAAVRRQPQIFGILRHRERDVRLELPGIDGMRKRHRRDKFLEIRIPRVLIELALGNGGCERLAPERERIPIELHLVRREAFPGESYA